MNIFNVSSYRGFTIVELLIVVVVIAILAAITVVGYTGISSRAKEGAIKSDLSQATKKIEAFKTLDANGNYPASTSAAGLTQTGGTTLTYSTVANSYCIQGTNGSLTYYASSANPTPTPGNCGAIPAAMQTITNATCATSRTLVADGRDGRSYWIQKLSDGKCWMLTNLAYAGGGTNTYGDVISLQDGFGQSSSYVSARYYMPPGANATVTPTAPSASTDGGVTGTQYGYVYNWCAAMGAQLTTSACANASTPAPSSAISICPANWRLPVGSSTGGEFETLNAAVNGGLTNTDAGLRATFLIQRSGDWVDGGFSNSGTWGMYWTSTQPSAGYARRLYANATSVQLTYSLEKSFAQAVRCIAN